MGCRVDAATNGREALAAVSQASYDLILMDCQMPELDGFATTRAIRERELQGPIARAHGPEKQQAPQAWQPIVGNQCLATRRIPIIALTAQAMSGDRERCVVVGMDDYLNKPFTREQLYATLQRWLPQRLAPSLTQTCSSSAHLSTRSLDHQALDNIRALQQEGTPDILVKVIRSYLASAPQLLQNLRTAITRNDAPALRKAAHTLTSSSASLGALTLAALCEELERMGRAPDITNAPAALSAVEAEYEAVRGDLVAELQATNR
jgi:CheY-like chemotaxis protein/HPt (histidine-containing phosphotransfer) domain-containing protein